MRRHGRAFNAHWARAFMSQTSFFLLLGALQVPLLLHGQLCFEFRRRAYSAAANTTAEVTPNSMATRPAPEAVGAGAAGSAIICLYE
eukprot:COSAG06_NODE_16886_length_975_cov_1.340183_2_plen_86_part_01